MNNTLRPEDAPGKRLGGLVGVASVCTTDECAEDENDVNWGFIHSSQSCLILFRAVFSWSEYHMKLKFLTKRWLQFDVVQSRYTDSGPHI